MNDRRTPQERYLTDAMFKRLVDTLESFVHQAQFTPSELREAALLAAIHYEEKNVRPQVLMREYMASKGETT